MNSLIFFLLYIIIRVALKDWDEGMSKSTTKSHSQFKTNKDKPFSKNILKNNGKMRRFSYPECYVNDIKI